MSQRADFIAWCNSTEDTTATSEALPLGARLPGPLPALIGDYVPPLPRTTLSPLQVVGALQAVYPGTKWEVRYDLASLDMQLYVRRGNSEARGKVELPLQVDDWLKAIAKVAESMFDSLGSGLEIG